MSNTRFNDIFGDVYGERLGISESKYPPPHFFKCDVCGKVFASLHWAVMRCPVDLDQYLFPREGKVHYSMERREWVLGSIRLSDASYAYLRGRLRGGRLEVHVEPVAEEAHTNEWGPVVP